jgi:phenylalanyl-tRNA synthetase alpha chain
LLGAGLFNRPTLRAAKINIPTGIAAGIGVERIAMMKYNITDIRDLYNNDFRFIKQFTKKGGN